MPKTKLNAVQRRTVRERVNYLEECEAVLEEQISDALLTIYNANRELDNIRADKSEIFRKVLRIA